MASMMVDPGDRKLFIFATSFLLLVALLAIVAISGGLFDPKPQGELISREIIDRQIRIDDEYQRLLSSNPSYAEYSVRLNAAWGSGDQDIGYGLKLGNENEGTIVAVSPLGYVTIMEQQENQAPAGIGLEYKEPDHIMPWQTWPHVRQESQTNEIWIDVMDSQMTSVRVNRELLWKGAAPLMGSDAFFWAESYGEPAIVTIGSYELFGAD